MFLVDTINHLQRSPYWGETAVVIAWTIPTAGTTT